MNFRRLSQLPLCHLVTELRVVWGPDMFQVDQIPLLQGLLAPHLTPETLPRIRSLVVTSLGADATAYLTAIGPKTFTPLRSLRSLTLSHTVHRNFQDIQLLICSFPYLDCLRLNGTWWNDDDIDSRTSLAASSASFAERLATLGDLTSLYAPPGAVARELPVGARSPASYDPASKWECFSASPLIRAVCEAVECPNKRTTERDLSCLILLVVFPKALPARISPHRESLGGASSDSFCSSEPFLALRARPLPAASETPPTRRIYYCSSAYSPANRYASGRRVRAFP